MTRKAALRFALRKPWRDRLAALKNLPPAVALLRRSGSTRFSLAILFRVLLALQPVAALWIGKLLVDLVANAARHPGPIGRRVWILLAAEFAVAAAGATLGRAIAYLDGRMADQFARDVSLKVMRHTQELDLQSFEDPDFYDKLERARVQGNDRIGMLNALGGLVQQTVTLASLSAGILLYSPVLFLLMVAAVVPAFLGESHFAFEGYALAYSLTPLRRELDYLRDLGAKKEAAKELKIFGLGDYLRERFTSVNDEIIGRSEQLAGRRLRAGAALAVAGSLGYYAAYALLVIRTWHGALTIGDLTFLAGALAGASGQIQMVFTTFTVIADHALFLTDLFAFFAMKPKIVSPAHAVPGPRSIRDGLEFRGVSFAYPDHKRLILDNLDLRIGAQERVAIVGANGQGKTTLVKLMTRLYEPAAGQILLDGVELRDYRLSDLRRQVGVIFQDFMRYDFAARENIAAARIQDRLEDDRLMEAAAKSGADEVLARLPDGLDQMLGRRFADGVELSGGEWQKIALARAHLRDAQILILDEPTAALDAMAEVFERFIELTRSKMAVLISHRFSTVRMSDRIVVLEGGAIREEGTHEQLIRRADRYARMFERQAACYR